MTASTAQSIADKANGVSPRISDEVRDGIIEAAAAGKYRFFPTHALDLSAVRWLEENGYRVVTVDPLIGCMTQTVVGVEW